MSVEATKSKRHFVDIECEEDFSAFDLIVDTASTAEIIPVDIPLKLKTWYEGLFKHLCNWEYEYDHEGPVVSYDSRKSLWNYEELAIDFSQQLDYLDLDPIIETEKEILKSELNRLNQIFTNLKERFKIAVDEIYDLSREMLSLSSDRGACYLQALKIEQKMIGLQKELFFEMDCFQHCKVKWLGFQVIKGKQNRESNLFGRPDFSIQKPSDRRAVNSLYQVYGKMLEVHGLYVARFINTAIETRDYLVFARKWLASSP